ncbi:MAG: thioesterase domain-containing protein, partial [Acidimicrobiia bacterium]|nr:thioesterase domain-containing protein [Acidimicrobiia bacterium]
LYRKELTRCAPDGPVILAAISLGAVVAYELAHQLEAEGRPVALLALFDAAGPDSAEADLTPTERLAVHRRELTADPPAYLRRQISKLRDRIGRRSEIVAAKVRDAAGMTLGDELRIRRFIEDNWRSQLTYEYRPYDGPVTVFKAADDPFGASLATNGMGWRRVVTGRLEVEPTAGGHLSMLAEPHVAELAPRLARAADAALRALTARGVDRSDRPGLAASQPIGAPRPIGAAQPVDASQLEGELIAALHAGHLGVAVARRLDDRGSLAPDARRLLAAADTGTRSLAMAALEEGTQAIGALDAVGVTASLEPVPDRVQHLSIGVRLADRATGDERTRYAEVLASIEALAARGYRMQDRLSPGALAALVRSGAACTLIRTDESTTRITLRWADDRRRWPWQPGRADLNALQLPAGAWWVYHLIRPFRLAGDRARGRVAGGDLGVFLGTPTAMVGDILALAEPDATDLVVDVGCGDGRVLIEAVSRFGCRARGLERDPDLVAHAMANVAEAGLDDRVTIQEADANSVDGRAAQAEATIVFLFLPAETTALLLPGLLAELPPGARVVAHEQVATTWPVQPSLTRLVIGTGITVAHVWSV